MFQFLHLYFRKSNIIESSVRKWITFWHTIKMEKWPTLDNEVPDFGWWRRAKYLWARTFESQNGIAAAAAAAAKSLQSCPTLCDPTDVSPLGSPVPGILQARTLEWVAISFSNAWKWKVKVKLLSHAWLLATPWTATYQAPPPMRFSRQEYWSRVPLPSPI